MTKLPSTYGYSPNGDTAERHINKYRNKNRIHTCALDGFHRCLYRILNNIKPQRLMDFGCGEGLLWERLARHGQLPSQIVGVDLRAEAIEEARRRFPDWEFACRPLEELVEAGDRFDVVLASQVLEHLNEPDAAAAALCRLSSRWVVLTVPWEPYFRLCNLARGRDIRRWGNHPEHVQWWSRRSFSAFAERHMEVTTLSSSFPFLIVVGRVDRLPQHRSVGRQGNDIAV